jgi:hypothetical protein
MAVETPHFAHPFTLAVQPGGSLAANVDEQDSVEDITACVTRIVSFVRGSRDELPEFGISDPLFQQAPVDTERLINEVGEWEDRADLSADWNVDSADELITHVRLNLDPTAEAE